MVFFCANARCWLSYNAALRAVRLGYSGVRWYRGGIDAWGRSGGALVEPKLVWRD
jgi:rhodanese-related sulfurtransferase